MNPADEDQPPPRDGAGADITTLLERWSAGDPRGVDVLLPVVYGELREMAERIFHREKVGHTLQPTALVHEAFLRLVGGSMTFRNRAHFYAIASQAMRQILVDHARAKQAAKRGGSQPRLELNPDSAEHPDASAGPALADVLAVDQAITRLAALEASQARLIELRFFGGLTIEEAAEVLDTSTATVKRNWRLARAFLLQELSN
jgi:RNA polymerase sigma factor (TIGR02999 family)